MQVNTISHFIWLFITAIVFLIVVYIFPTSVFAQVYITEIYPSPNTGEYEWVEIFNASDDELDISCFELYDSTGKSLEITDSTILPQSYVIATASNILNNSGDTVFLSNYPVGIIESVTFDTVYKSWSYSLCDNTWRHITNPTQGQPNDCAGELPTAVPFPTSAIPTPIASVTSASGSTPTQTTIQTPTSTSASATPTSAPQTTGSTNPTASTTENIPSGIIISEVMPAPASGENEWIELFNNNNISVTLHNWAVDDIEGGGSSPRTFTLTMNPYGYHVIEISSYMFNNTGDDVRLLTPSGNIADSFHYSQIEKEKSIGRATQADSTICIQQPTKGYKNSGCINDENEEDDEDIGNIISPADTSIKNVLGSTTSLAKKPTGKTTPVKKANGTLSKTSSTSPVNLSKQSRKPHTKSRTDLTKAAAIFGNPYSAKLSLSALFSSICTSFNVLLYSVYAVTKKYVSAAQ